jgi:hypothetical protein
MFKMAEELDLNSVNAEVPVLDVMDMPVEHMFLAIRFSELCEAHLDDKGNVINGEWSTDFVRKYDERETMEHLITVSDFLEMPALIKACEEYFVILVKGSTSSQLKAKFPSQELTEDQKRRVRTFGAFIFTDNKSRSETYKFCNIAIVIIYCPFCPVIDILKSQMNIQARGNNEIGSGYSDFRTAYVSNTHIDGVSVVKLRSDLDASREIISELNTKVDVLQKALSDMEMRVRVLEYTPRGKGGSMFEKDYTEEVESGLLAEDVNEIELIKNDITEMKKAISKLDWNISF